MVTLGTHVLIDRGTPLAVIQAHFAPILAQHEKTNHELFDGQIKIKEIKSGSAPFTNPQPNTPQPNTPSKERQKMTEAPFVTSQGAPNH